MLGNLIAFVIGLAVYDYVKTKNPNKMFHQIIIDGVTNLFKKNT